MEPKKRRLLFLDLREKLQPRTTKLLEFTFSLPHVENITADIFGTLQL